jgi:formylglycine-generating enzyme required for sulfatase activity
MAVTAPELVSIPAGPFVMGAEDGDENERPEHPVFLEAYALGVAPVTQAEYARFIRDTGWRPPGVWELPSIVRPARAEEFKRLAAPYWWMGADPPAGRDDHPVVLVTFEDARAYCRWLTEHTGRLFRLPTEAEWEKAARGGLAGCRYPWGDEIDVSKANFTSAPGQRAARGTMPCRSYPPNGLGAFDMAGNAWNWVSDWYRADYYAVGEERNPAGPASGTLRVVRGGAWTNDDVAYLRCACRHPVPPDTYSYSIGFRVACAD